jgi:hypothetical protein
VQASIQRVSILLGAVLLALVGAYSWYIFHHGELADKPYWAALQSVEYKNRPNRDARPLLEMNVDGAGSDAVGVPGGDSAGTRVWVMLNVADSEGDSMALPRGVALNGGCGQLERMVKGREVLPVVRKFLFKGCAAGV